MFHSVILGVLGYLKKDKKKIFVAICELFFRNLTSSNYLHMKIKNDNWTNKPCSLVINITFQYRLKDTTQTKMNK